MEVFENTNLGIRLALEACALIAFGCWGFTRHSRTFEKWGYGIGLPLLVAIAWALVIAPGSTFEAPLGIRLVLEVVVFGGASLALYQCGRPPLAGILLVAAIANRALMLIWDQ